MRFVLLIIALGSIAHAQPAADAVALLPLDADQRLEIYGQPVASEVARALVAGGIDVVVVGPKMAVPERARLIVDGKITGAGKADVVSLSLRIRDRSSGSVLDTIAATAPSLTEIDSAATELSAKILPAVKLRLAALVKAADHAGAPKPPLPVVSAPVQPMLVSVGASLENTSSEPLRAALGDQLAAWSTAHHREAKPVDVVSMSRSSAAKTVATSGADLGIVFEILGYTTEPGPVPMARARVRLRIADSTRIAFDRVIVTDTIVGDRGLDPKLLAARVAREVLWIAQPNLRRTVASWK